MGEHDTVKIVAHTDDGRFLVARSDSPKADAVVVVGGRTSPVVPVGSITAQAEAGEWIEGSGTATPVQVRRILEVAATALG